MRCFSWLRWWLDWASETSFFFPTSWNSTRLFASHCGLPLSIPFARPCPPWKGRRKGLSRAGIEDCAQGIAQMSQLSQSGLNPYTGPHLYNNVKPRPCVSSELRMELMRLLSRAEHRIASHRIAQQRQRQRQRQCARTILARYELYGTDGEKSRFAPLRRCCMFLIGPLLQHV
jgi:hypothetical protein